MKDENQLWKLRTKSNSFSNKFQTEFLELFRSIYLGRQIHKLKSMISNKNDETHQKENVISINADRMSILHWNQINWIFAL